MSIEKLQAENARLKTEVEHLMIFCNSTLIPSKELQAENARLKAEVDTLKEGNECLDKMHEKEMARSAYLCEEVNRTTAWGRGLEADLSHARVEVSFLKAEVERLRASSFVTAVPVEQYERLLEAGDALAREICILGPVDDKEMKAIEAWNAAKEGKQP